MHILLISHDGHLHIVNIVSIKKSITATINIQSSLVMSKLDKLLLQPTIYSQTLLCQLRYVIMATNNLESNLVMSNLDKLLLQPTIYSQT